MNFFIGQRVRIKADGQIRDQFIGIEARFHCYGKGLGDRNDDRDNCCISVAGEIWGAHTDVLEPITPSGHQPSEFTTLHDLLESLEGVAA